MVFVAERTVVRFIWCLDAEVCSRARLLSKRGFGGETTIPVPLLPLSLSVRPLLLSLSTDKFLYIRESPTTSRGAVAPGKILAAGAVALKGNG